MFTQRFRQYLAQLLIVAVMGCSKSSGPVTPKTSPPPLPKDAPSGTKAPKPSAAPKPKI